MQGIILYNEKHMDQPKPPYLFVLVGIVAGLIIGIPLGYVAGTKVTPVPLVESNIADENPLSGVSANPLDNVKINPYEGVKYNPFE